MTAWTSQKPKLDREQHELIEKAQDRIRQKKRLYQHFVLFLVGSVFLILLNKALKVGAGSDWFVWAITAWAFLFCVHFFNVFIGNRFLDKEWERKQREKLIALQKRKIEELRTQVEKEYPARSKSNPSQP